MLQIAPSSAFLFNFLMPEFFPISDAQFYLATVLVLALCVLLFWVVGYDPRRALSYLRRNAAWVALNALLVIVAAHALLLAPPPPADTPCVESHHVWGPLMMVLTCDSYEFVRTARHPGRLSMSGSVRQSRPLEILIASLLTLAEVPNPESRSHRAAPEQNLALDGQNDKPCENCIQTILGYPYGVRLQPGWLPFVILNFFVLLVALMLFRRLNAPVTSAAVVAVAVLGVFLVFNSVVKGFFWSAHTQMWNVLMPLISISLSAAFLRHPARSWRFMIATGALLGIASLAYASLVVCAPVAIAAILLGFWINRERPPLLSLIGKICLFVGAFAAPSVIWINILLMRSGTYYHFEFQECRQFVWIYDYWRAGGATALENRLVCGQRLQTQSFLGEFFMHLWNGMWPALVLLAIALIVGVMSPARLKETLRARSAILGAAAITLVMCLGFFALMGFYRDRLEFNVVVPAFVIASVIVTGLLERVPRKQTIVTIVLLVVAAAGYIIAALVRVGSYV